MVSKRLFVEIRTVVKCLFWEHWLCRKWPDLYDSYILVLVTFL